MNYIGQARQGANVCALQKGKKAGPGLSMFSVGRPRGIGRFQSVARRQHNFNVELEQWQDLLVERHEGRNPKKALVRWPEWSKTKKSPGYALDSTGH